jgi:hypothetical protein
LVPSGQYWPFTQAVHVGAALENSNVVRSHTRVVLPPV